eukprot:Clim_evm8s41 gene=Clim_evmTU8s41
MVDVWDVHFVSRWDDTYILLQNCNWFVNRTMEMEGTKTSRSSTVVSDQDTTSTATTKRSRTISEIMDNESVLQVLRSKKAFILDMDGVLYWESHTVPGATEFIQWLQDNGKLFMCMTNGSTRTPKDLSVKLAKMGVNVEPQHFFTAALSTASFLNDQAPGEDCYCIGGSGLISALYDIGYTMNDMDPSYVVVGETSDFNYDKLTVAVNLVRQGAKLIGTNIDMYDKSVDGIKPGTGTLCSAIEAASGKKAYYCGKPSPLMFRTVLKKLGVHPSEAVMIGDRMDTDVIGALEAGLSTILVLSGVTDLKMLEQYAYKPTLILESVADIVESKLPAFMLNASKGKKNRKTDSTDNVDEAHASGSTPKNRGSLAVRRSFSENLG